MYYIAESVKYATWPSYSPMWQAELGHRAVLYLTLENEVFGWWDTADRIEVFTGFLDEGLVMFTENGGGR